MVSGQPPIRSLYVLQDVHICTLGPAGPITLTPHGGEIARSLPHHQMLLPDLENEIAYTLAGRAAEKLILGDMSAGAGGGDESDLAIATRIAIMIESQFGLGSQGALWSGVHEIDKLETEAQNMVRARLRAGEERATTILRQYRTQLIAIARKLQQQRHLSGEDLRRHGLGAADPEAERPSQQQPTAEPSQPEGPVAEPDAQRA